VKRRALRWSAELLAALLVLCAALAGLAWYGLNSERGLRELAVLAQRLSGGTLRLGATQGRLLGEFLIEDIGYQAADGTRVELKRLHLRLRPRELLQRRLHLEAAEAEGLQVWLPPPQAGSPAGAIDLPGRLPLDLLLDAFSLRDFQLHQPGAAEPLQIPDADLSGSWIGEDIRIARLGAELPQTGPLQLTATARIGSDRIVFGALDLKGPGELQASGTLALGKSDNDLRLSWKDLRWPLEGPAGERQLAGVEGSARLSGPLEHYQFELRTAAILHQLPVKLSAAGEGDLQQAQFTDLSLAAEKGSAHVQGKLAWAPDLRADLKGTIQQLDPALFAKDWQGLINGRFDTHTTMRQGQPDIGFSLSVDKSQLRGYPLSLTAQGDSDARSVHLQQFLLQSGPGSLSAAGTVGWQPALRADLQAHLRNFDPAQFFAGFKGSINGSLAARTDTRTGKPDLNLNVNIDRSQLRGRPLTLAAEADWSGSTLMLQQLALSAGASRLDASGRATPPFDLKGRVDSPDLAQLAPQLGGRAAFDFSLQGPLEHPHLLSKGKAQDLRYLAYHVATLDWDADLDPDQPSHLNIDAAEALAGILIHSAKLSLSGQETYHQARLEVQSERGALSLELDGGYDRRAREWGGQLSTARVAAADLPPWTLQEAAGLLLGARRESLEPACFAGDAGRICLQLEQNVTGSGLRLSLNLERLLLDAFKPLLPPQYALSGELNGSGHIDIANGDIAAVDADLRTEGVRFQAPKAPPVEILPSTLKADDRNGTLHALLDLHLPQGSIDADLSAAPGADLQARPLSGQLRVQVPDLGFVQSLLPGLQAVSGSIAGSLDFGGSIGLPRVQGQIALRDGHARVTQAGIELQQLQLSVTGQGAGPLAIDGSLQSGGGKLTLTGTLDPSLAPPRADLDIQGQDFQAVATPDARIWVTPQLQLQSAADGMHLQGTLSVPKADITPRGLGNSGVAVSPDQVIVGAEATAEEETLKVYSSITVSLGDAVNFKGFGLTTRLAGAVTVNEEPHRVSTGQGQLQLLEGHYKAYGQDLSIETGRLIFTGGPVTAPAVDLYATRHPQSDITVGVRVRGTLDHPLLTLESVPTMPSDQQLSWLVLGRSLETASTGDAGALSQAALSLGLGNDYTQNIAKHIGLDQIGLVQQGPGTDSSVAANAAAIQGSQAALNAGTASDPNSAQAAQLTLGKYLTPRLFVSYGVGLLQPGQTFRLLYDLGHGFKLQTESGVASGGDLLYTIERGH
jgi:translocation and assembly module TamB